MISRLAAQAGRARSNAGARTIAVYSPKGGSGKSTLAVNLAAALARANEDDVLLVDLALPYNHAALLARLSPTSCLARTAHLEAAGFEMALRGNMVRHESGFMVLSTALRPEEADVITTELVTRTLEIAGRMFRFIVFDLGIALSDPVLTALEVADHIVPVVTPELTSMKDCSQFLEILTQVLHVPASSVHLTVNRRTPDPGMTRADVERVLGQKVAVEVAYDGARPEQAALRGEFLVLTQPRSGIARGTAQLAESLGSNTLPAPRSASGEEAARRAGWFGYALS
jgi:pilus assembly protein CpaE